MCLERVRTAASARCRIPVSACADHYASRAGIVTPESDTADKGGQLAAVEASGVLGTQFIEQFACVDVRPCIEPAAHQRPDQRERVTPLDVESRKLLSLDLALLFNFWIQLRHGWPIRGDDRLRRHGYNFRLGGRGDLSLSDGVSVNKRVDSPQVAWLRLYGVGRTHFTRPPSA